MRVPWLVVVIAVYVSLDVSNPLMPGALTFGVEDSVEARHADRSRAYGLAVSPRLACACERLASVEPAVTPGRLAAPAPARPRHDHVSRSDPSGPPPDPVPEDH